MSPVEDSPNLRRDLDNNSNEDRSMPDLGLQDLWVRDRDVSNEEGNSANNPLDINKSEQTFGDYTNQEDCASISSQCLDKDSRMTKSEQCNGNTEISGMKKDGDGDDHSCESSISGVNKITRKNMSAGSDEIRDTDECIPQSSGNSLDFGSSKNGTEINIIKMKIRSLRKMHLLVCQPLEMQIIAPALTTSKYRMKIAIRTVKMKDTLDLERLARNSWIVMKI